MAKRVIIMLLDSVGIGFSHDAKFYGDIKKGGDYGANTLGNIINHYPDIKLPNLTNLGIINCLSASVKTNGTANRYNILPPVLSPTASYGYGVEVSKGKDTTTGHWELMGCPVDFDWGYFTQPENSFPQNLLNNIYQKSGISGSLGNCSASGTEIIERLGEEHIKTLKPIFYTSADSVFQIAASEEFFSLDKLYEVCQIARQELYEYNIARVIARPFVGNSKETFKRTENRKDYSITPTQNTVLNNLVEEGGKVIAIGKINDIFAGSGISESIKASGLPTLFNKTIEQIEITPTKNTIIFTNFVDFDSEYGHRRDVKGYKEALEYFDSRLPEALAKLTDNDLLFIIADHGNDPTWYGSDHTREHIPVLIYNTLTNAKNLGELSTFSDIGQTIASYLNIKPIKYGKSVL